MQKITCEACGSHDIVKQDGVFVCQYCGCKYTVEEMKKLVVSVQGNVNVSGSVVRLDRSPELENQRILARCARDHRDAAETAKYYGKVLEQDPQDWEAFFYYEMYNPCNEPVCPEDPCYCRLDRQIVNLSLYLDAVMRRILNAMPDEDGEEPEDNGTEDDDTDNDGTEDAGNEYAEEGPDLLEVLQEITEASVSLANSCFRKIKTVVTDPESCPDEPLQHIYSFMYLLGDQIEKSFGEEYNVDSYAVSAWKCGVKVHRYQKEQMGEDCPHLNWLTGYQKKIDDLQPDRNDSAAQSRTEGCYIATAVYGSYDCPQVWTLRRFRDEMLAASVWGRIFIRAYYALSPMLVRRFGDCGWFRRFWRCPLDALVRRLQSRGVESTPYADPQRQDGSIRIL